ncbi:uncharacterized protein LOC142228844 [Haematobia irritans]|uniref:uncharacterized protein LOC142228844 n=1 Tax=Haematobia irritans TaxID=7368 RepID=UPI003F4FDCDA
MATISCLSSYNTYSNYTKCGEILKSAQIGEKQYALLCLECHEICLQFQTFVIHIEKEHQDSSFENVRTKEEQFDGIGEPFATINEFSKLSAEDEDKKDFIADPLEEPEVLLTRSSSQQRERDKLVTKHQTRQQISHETRRKKSEQAFKQEQDEISSEPTMSNAANYSGQFNEVDTSIKISAETSTMTIKDDISYNNNAIVDYDDEEEDDDDDADFLIRDDTDDIYDKEFLGEIRDDDDGSKPSPAKKSKVKLDVGLDIDEFMNNKLGVLAFIAAYQKQDELWDSTRPPKLVNRCRKKRDECLKHICQEIQELNIPMTIRDAEKCIKYMRVRYIRDVRIRMQYIKNKDKDYKPLWFYDHLEFLKPTLSFIQELQEEQLLAKPKLNDDQIVSLIEIYKKHSCLWNEQDIFYYSEQRRQLALQTVIEEVERLLQLKYTTDEVEDKIDFIHKIVKKEKENSIQYLTNAPNGEYKSSCKYYEHISYLLAHLGPFKCPFCPKVLMHVATFRIHVSKHDGSKPFKCSICNYEFTQKPGYVIHLRRHIQDFPFVCKYCSKGFPCKKELKLHFQNHPEYEKEFICDVCGEGFTQQKLLNWHLKAHNNIRDSICNICGKGFTNSKLLFQHRTVHSKEKSVCKLCGKTYAHYRGLSRHMSKDHGTTVAAVAAVMGEKPKKRVLTLNDIS